MVFQGFPYQINSLIEELLEIERHSKDGSAAKGACSCIQDKHMRLVKGLSAEAIPLTKDVKIQSFLNNLSTFAENRLESIYNLIKTNPSLEQSQEFYNKLSVDVREWRIALEQEDWKLPSIEHPLACGCKLCPPCQINHA